MLERDSWIWSASSSGDQFNVVVGSDDSTVALYQLLPNTVHGLHQVLYAYRKSLTDVAIQHLTMERTTTLSTGGLIKVCVHKICC